MSQQGYRSATLEQWPAFQMQQNRLYTTLFMQWYSSGPVNTLKCGKLVDFSNSCTIIQQSDILCCHLLAKQQLHFMNLKNIIRKVLST